MRSGLRSQFVVSEMPRLESVNAGVTMSPSELTPIENIEGGMRDVGAIYDKEFSHFGNETCTLRYSALLRSIE